MDKTLIAPRRPSLRRLVAGLWAADAEAQRNARDAAALAEMPAERLADMGLPPRTEANRRTSGEPGAVPKAALW